jgi:AGCS family alanine or glycine:cation symporter
LELFEQLLGSVSDIVWGPPLLILLVGTGLFLTIRIGGLQFSLLGYALKLAFSKNQDKASQGDVSHFQSLMTALAATIGTGNIAGVATAVYFGGPGAIFWMWMIALVGMATKYAEAVLAVKYRVVDSNGEMAGGPMYFLERGLKQKWLAVSFALFGAIAAFGIGNMVQANSVSHALESHFGVPTWIAGIVLAALTGLVVVGGIKSIGKVTAVLVPFMAIVYVVGGLVVLAINITAVPAAFALIVTSAFTGHAATGGFVGAAMIVAVRWGVARGVFSNEAGLGSAPIAAAAAKTDHPVRQGLVSMTGTFLDTIIVASITGLVLVTSGVWNSGLNGAALTTAAFEQGLPGPGGLIVAFGIIFFAYSTILGWAYYGERCFGYLFGWGLSLRIYRYAWVLAVAVGSTLALETVWNFADVMNGLMAIPNLIGLIFLSGVVVSETKEFLKIREQEKKAIA